MGTTHKVDELAELVAVPRDEEEYDLPSYSTPGRMLIRVEVRKEVEPFYGIGWRYDVEVLDYDVDTSIFWIQEGVDFEYWVCMHCDIEYDGWYVVEGITGTYVKGDGWMTDDDEEWEFERVRKATVDEIMFEVLRDK